MKTILLSALAVALLLSSSSRTSAQDAPVAPSKPVVAVAFPSYNRILEILGFLGKLADDPDLATKLEDQIKQVTQGKGLAGLDKTKAWGVVLSTDGIEFRPMAFVPVTSLKEFLDTLGTIPGLPPMELEDKGNGLFVINDIMIKEQNGWAFIAQNEDGLKDLPADPVQLLGGLNKEYDVAIRAHVNNIPPLYRQMAAGFLQQGAQVNLEHRLPNEDDESYELRKKMTEMQIEQFITAVNEMDQFTIGWKMDDSARTTYLDFSMTAMPDTTTAKDWARLKDSKTDNAGFMLPGAAATFLYAVKLSQHDIEQSGALVAAMRTQAANAIDQDNDIADEATKKTIKDVVGQLIDVLQKTVESGKLDAGASLLLGEKSLTFAGGAFVADGPAVEEALKKIVALMQNEPDFPGVKFNVESHAGVNFHTTAIPVPDEEAREFLGDKVDVVVGIGPKAAYLAVGKDSMEKLKAAIDKSQASLGKTVIPMQISAAASPIIKFSQQFEENETLAAIGAEIQKVEGKDHLNITVTSIKDGGRFRFEAEEGVLKAMAMGAKLAAGQAGL